MEKIPAWRTMAVPSDADVKMLSKMLLVSDQKRQTEQRIRIAFKQPLERVEAGFLSDLDKCRTETDIQWCANHTRADKSIQFTRKRLAVLRRAICLWLEETKGTRRKSTHTQTPSKEVALSA